MKTNALGLVFTALMLASTAHAQAPHYEADPYWPKPLPDRWVLGGLGGLCIDAQADSGACGQADEHGLRDTVGPKDSLACSYSSFSCYSNT